MVYKFNLVMIIIPHKLSPIKFILNIQHIKFYFYIVHMVYASHIYLSFIKFTVLSDEHVITLLSIISRPSILPKCIFSANENYCFSILYTNK